MMPESPTPDREVQRDLRIRTTTVTCTIPKPLTVGDVRAALDELPGFGVVTFEQVGGGQLDDSTPGVRLTVTVDASTFVR